MGEGRRGGSCHGGLVATAGSVGWLVSVRLQREVRCESES